VCYTFRTSLRCWQLVLFALPQQLYQRCGSVLHLPLNLAVLVYLPHHLALLVHFPHKLAVLVCSTTLTLWRGSLHPTPMFKCGIQPALSLTWHQICRPGFELACVRSRLPGRRVKEKQYVAGLGYRGRLGRTHGLQSIALQSIGLQSIGLQSIGLQCCVGANHEIAPTDGLLNSSWHF